MDRVLSKEGNEGKKKKKKDASGNRTINRREDWKANNVETLRRGSCGYTGDPIHIDVPMRMRVWFWLRTNTIGAF